LLEVGDFGIGLRERRGRVDGLLVLALRAAEVGRNARGHDA
jgi:hypothetical protein